MGNKKTGLVCRDARLFALTLTEYHGQYSTVSYSPMNRGVSKGIFL